LMLLLDRFKFDVAHTLVANSAAIAANGSALLIEPPLIV
jgi:hypothetical protein